MTSLTSYTFSQKIGDWYTKYTELTVSYAAKKRIPDRKELIPTGRKSTRKGANGEREIMAILREHGYPVERGGTQSYGQRPDLYGLDGIHLEIKRSECARIWDWMEQSKEDSQRFKDGVPTVIFRRNRSDWLVCMELEDWLTIYKGRCKCGGQCKHHEE